MPKNKSSSQQPIPSPITHPSPRQSQNGSQTTNSLNQTSTNSPSQILSLHRLQDKSNQMFNSFQFKDQVTFKKINVRNLHRSCQDVKQIGKLRKIVWTQEIYEQEKQDCIVNLEYFMKYIEELRAIKTNRNCQLLGSFRNRENFMGKLKERKKEIKMKRSIDSQESQTDKIINLRHSLEEKIKKEKRMMDKMKAKIYEINVQQFRNYFNKRRSFDPKSLNLLKLPQHFSKAAQFKPLIDTSSRKQRSNNEKKRKKDREMKNKIRLECDSKFQKETEQFNKLLKMRFRHETQFNWENKPLL